MPWYHTNNPRIAYKVRYQGEARELGGAAFYLIGCNKKPEGITDSYLTKRMIPVRILTLPTCYIPQPQWGHLWYESGTSVGRKPKYGHRLQRVLVHSYFTP